MNITQIENNLQRLIKSFKKETFIYDLLLAYDTPKSTITRLQKGGLNLSKVENEIAWKKKLFYKPAIDENPQTLFALVKSNEKINKHSPRFIIVTDYKILLAFDTKTQDLLDIAILDIAKHFDFFLPWAGMEKAQHQVENPADVKAAERMAKLYDEIKKDNPTKTQEQVHNLNVFLSRLLFCFFAEDTDIFNKAQFTTGISSHTQQDGSDLHDYLDKLFVVMNTDYPERKNLPAYLDAFPYVNGGLFSKPHTAPIFTRRSRQVAIEIGELDWSAINPDIFGSMIQAVITSEHRGGLGMHYTSVPNIMKVIEPLFLTELHEEFEASKYDPRRLHKLLERIGQIKIFDPACGSGNFLIIAYKEMRMLEIKILQQLQTLQKVATGFEPKQLELIPKPQLTLAASYQPTMFSRVDLSNFYGIELDDFAHEVAILSLWLAQHQMNMKFKEAFGTGNPTLPLKEGGHITHGNATRINWEKACPIKVDDEIYILGNPPYLGGKSQSKGQKEDMAIVFSGIQNYKELDYIASWFLLAANFINELNSARFAFVTTSSINQGAQVSQLWPLIYSRNLEISFAYHPFPWSNNAKSNAGVSVSIIGIGHKSLNKKTIYSGSHKYNVENINSYILPARDVIISQRLNLLSNLPQMITGNSPYDNNNLRFNDDFKSFIENKYPQVKPLIKRTIGADELLNDIYKYCFWITNEQLELAESIPEIKERIEKTRAFRFDGGDVARGIANRSYQFRYTHTAKKEQIIIPIVSSERREYIPIGFTDNNSVVISSAAAIYDPELYIFSIISSKIHNCWLRLTSGKLDSRIRYLSALSWNTFPFPEINQEQKQELERHAYAVLGERENHSENTLAQLYDPDKMPDGLREAHHQLDLAVERCYRSKPFANDEERLEYLFKLYEQMIAEEKEKNGELNFGPVKVKTKKKRYA
jgi:type I restriction-modification system DNA methylase subunit